MGKMNDLCPKIVATFFLLRKPNLTTFGVCVLSREKLAKNFWSMQTHFTPFINHLLYEENARA